MRVGGFASLVLVAVAGAFLVSGVLLVYVRHEHRTQFRVMQELIAERDALEVEWGALQLERATIMGYLRIDREARERLGMREPEQGEIVFLRPISPHQARAR